MKIVLTREHVKTIKSALQWSIQNITNHQHDNYEIKKSSLKPYEKAMAALPNLGKVKDL